MCAVDELSACFQGGYKPEAVPKNRDKIRGILSRLLVSIKGSKPKEEFDEELRNLLSNPMFCPPHSYPFESLHKPEFSIKQFRSAISQWILKEGFSGSKVVKLNYKPVDMTGVTDKRYDFLVARMKDIRGQSKTDIKPMWLYVQDHLTLAEQCQDSALQMHYYVSVLSFSIEIVKKTALQVVKGLTFPGKKTDEQKLVASKEKILQSLVSAFTAEMQEGMVGLMQCIRAYFLSVDCAPGFEKILQPLGLPKALVDKMKSHSAHYPYWQSECVDYQMWLDNFINTIVDTPDVQDLLKQRLINAEKEKQKTIAKEKLAQAEAVKTTPVSESPMTDAVSDSGVSVSSPERKVVQTAEIREQCAVQPSCDKS
ncbi:MAG: hypothetical protein V4490_00740, partial [Pseudomonadota bacterium]